MRRMTGTVPAAATGNRGATDRREHQVRSPVRPRRITRRIDNMEIAVFACLAGGVLYLARRLSAANTENLALRTQVASLKRQLRGRGPARA